MDSDDLLLSDQIDNSYIPGSHLIIHRRVDELIRRLDDQSKRFDVLKDAIVKATNSLYTIVVEIFMQRSQLDSYKKDGAIEPEDVRVISETQFEELEELACHKIKDWAQSGRLLKHKKLNAILQEWKRCDKTQSLEKFVADCINDDDKLTDFISGFVRVGPSYTEGDYANRTEWDIDIKSMSTVADLTSIEQRAKHVCSSTYFHSLDDRRKQILERLLKTINDETNAEDF